MTGIALTAANHNNMHLCTFVPTCLCIFAVVAKSTVSDLCTLCCILKLFLQTDGAYSEECCALLKTWSTSSQKTLSQDNNISTRMLVSSDRTLVRSGLTDKAQGYKPKIKWLFLLTYGLHAAVHAHTALGELFPANWGYSPGNGDWGRHEGVIRS